jgi:hypothetical protein
MGGKTEPAGWEALETVRAERGAVSRAAMLRDLVLGLTPLSGARPPDPVGSVWRGRGDERDAARGRGRRAGGLLREGPPPRRGPAGRSTLTLQVRGTSLGPSARSVRAVLADSGSASPFERIESALVRKLWLRVPKVGRCCIMGARPQAAGSRCREAKPGRMTTALALICQDGLVIGTDTKVTYGLGMKKPGAKLFTTECLGADKRTIVIAGAGAMRHVQDAVAALQLEHLGELLGENASFNEFLSKDLEVALPRFAKDYREKYQESPNFELLIGCVEKDGRAQLVQVYSNGD